MKIELFQHVKLKSDGVGGIVVDIYEQSGKEAEYTVELDERDENGDFPLRTCSIEEIVNGR